MTPLLVLLLLLTALTHTVLCEDEVSADPESETQNTDAQDVEPESEAAGVEEEPSDITSTPDSSPTHVTDTEPKENEEEHDRSDNLGAEPTEDTVGTGGTSAPLEEDLGLIIIIIPVVLAVVIIAIIVCIFFTLRRGNSKTRHSEVSKEDPYLDGSSTEKVPMPMFEEDVPSVLELEMEELDDWMKKDGETANGSKQA